MDRIDRLIWEANSALAALEPERAASAECAGGAKTLSAPRPKKRRRWLRAALAAAAVAAVLTGAAYAAGILGGRPHWNEELFWFSPPGEWSAPDTAPAGRRFAALEEALSYYGAPDNMVPAYTPAGYKRGTFDCLSMGGSVFLGAVWNDGQGGAIFLSYVLYGTGDRTIYSKDGGDPEIYVSGGVEHYIMTNMDRYLAVWQRDDFECSVSGFESREELIKTIDSMYAGENQ